MNAKEIRECKERVERFSTKAFNGLRLTREDKGSRREAIEEGIQEDHFDLARCHIQAILEVAAQLADINTVLEVILSNGLPLQDR